MERYKEIKDEFTEKERPVTFEHLISKFDDAINRIPTSHELLVAFTLTNAGEEFNMERLEILGDVFLKYSIGIRLFCDSKHNMEAEEGMLSLRRSQIVGNRNLFNKAITNEFPQMISARKLMPYLNFMPPRYSQKEGLEQAICNMDEEFGEKSNTSKSIVQLLTKEDVKKLSDNDMDRTTQKELVEKALKNEENKEFSTDRHTRYDLREFVRIGDKSLADVVEAVLGCFLEVSGQSGALKIMKHLKLDEKGAFMIQDLPTNAFLPHCIENSHEKEFTEKKLQELLSKIDAKKLEKILGYKFKESSFLLQAMTHASYIGNRITASYERLEFLGDGILDYLITCYLYTYKENEIKTPGEITELRSALVQNNVSKEKFYLRF